MIVSEHCKQVSDEAVASQSRQIWTRRTSAGRREQLALKEHLIGRNRGLSFGCVGPDAATQRPLPDLAIRGIGPIVWKIHKSHELSRWCYRYPQHSRTNAGTSDGPDVRWRGDFVIMVFSPILHSSAGNVRRLLTLAPACTPRLRRTVHLEKDRERRAGEVGVGVPGTGARSDNGVAQWGQFDFE